MIPPLQFVHALKVKLQAALLAIDLNLIAILVTRGKARCLKACDRAARHARHEEDRIIHGALTLAAATNGALGALAGNGTAG